VLEVELRKAHGVELQIHVALLRQLVVARDVKPHRGSVGSGSGTGGSWMSCTLENIFSDSCSRAIVNRPATDDTVVLDHGAGQDASCRAGET
jgi:hypothetical protein